MKINFTKSDGAYILKDALILPDDHSYSEDEIEAMKQARFDDWYAIVTAPSPEPEPEPEPEEFIEEQNAEDAETELDQGSTEAE
jgi:hypothetical protein